MKTIITQIEHLLSLVRKYIDTKVEYAKLTAAEKLSQLFASIITCVITGLLFLFFTAFASMALAVVLGEWLGKTWQGMLIVAGIYFIIGVIVWTRREKLIHKPILDALVKRIFSES